jgi:chromosome segregation ATPase
LALLEAAQAAAEELQAAHFAAAAAASRCAKAEAAKDTLSTALERYADLVVRYEQCVASQRLRLKLRDAAGMAPGSTGDSAAAAAEIEALEQQLMANPANVHLQMIIDDLIEATSDEGIDGTDLLDEVEGSGSQVDEADVLTAGRRSSKLRLPATLTYIPAALHAAVAHRLAPTAASSVQLAASQQQVVALASEVAALRTALQQHEVTWENAETAAKARREEQVITMQQWREEQRWGAKVEALQCSLTQAVKSADAARASAATEAARCVQIAAASARFEADAKEKSVRLDALEMTATRLRREVSTVAASGEEEVQTVRGDLQGNILALEGDVASLHAQLAEAQGAGEEALALLETSQSETESVRAALLEAKAFSDTLQEELVSLRTEHCKVELDLEQAQSEAQETTGLLSVSDGQITDLKREVTEAQHKAKQSLRAVQVAKFNIESMELDVKQNMDEASMYRSRNNELRAELVASTEAMQALKEKSEAAAATHAKALAALSDLKANASASASEEQAATAAVQAELGSVRDQLETVGQEAVALRHQAGKLEEQLSQVSADLSASQAEAVDANAAAGEATRNAIAAREALIAAKERLQQVQASTSAAAVAADRQAQDASDQLEDARAALSESRVQLQAVSDQLLAARAAAAKSAEDAASSKHLHTAAEAAAAALRSDLMAARAACAANAAELSTALYTAAQAASEAEVRHSAVVAALAEAKREAVELAEKLDITSSDASAASAEVEHLQARAATLSLELEAALAGQVQAKGDLQLAKEELMATRGGATAARDASTQAQGALQAIQAELRSTDALLSSVSESLEEEVLARREAEDSAKTAAASAATALAASQASLATSEAALSAATERLEVLEAQADSLRAVQESLLGSAGGGTEEIMAALEAQRAKAAASAAEAARTQERLSAAEAQVAQVLASAEVDAASAKQASQDAASRHTTVTSSLALVKSELSAVREELVTARANEVELQSALDAHDKHTGLVQRLEAQLARVMQERDTAQQEAAAAKQASLEARDKASAAGGVNGSQAGRIATLEAQAHKLQQQVLSEKARSRIIARERDEATVEAAAAAREAADATAAHRSAVASAAAASTRAISADQHIDGSAGVVAGYAAQLSSARDALVDLARAVVHLQAKLAFAEESASARGRVKITLRLNKQIDAYKERIAALEGGRSIAAPADLAARDRAIGQLQGQVEELTGAIATCAHQLGIQSSVTGAPTSNVKLASSAIPACVPLRALFAAGPTGEPLRQAMVVVTGLEQSRDDVTQEGVGIMHLPEVTSQGLASVVERPGVPGSSRAASAQAHPATTVSVPEAKQLVHLMAGSVREWARRPPSAAAVGSPFSAAFNSPGVPRTPGIPTGGSARSPLGMSSSANTPQATPQRKHAVRGLTYSPGGATLLRPPGVSTPDYVQWAAASSANSGAKSTPGGSKVTSGGFFC